MKSNRTSISLIYIKRSEISPGVWENVEQPITVKAAQERIYQSRIEIANAEGNQINGRFRVKAHLLTNDLTYVLYKNKKYKVSLLDNNAGIIEAGELMS